MSLRGRREGRREFTVLGTKRKYAVSDIQFVVECRVEWGGICGFGEEGL